MSRVLIITTVDKMSDRTLQLLAMVAPSTAIVRNTQLAHRFARLSPLRQYMVRTRFRTLVKRGSSAEAYDMCIHVHVLPNGRRDGLKLRHVGTICITRRYFSNNMLHGDVVEWDFAVNAGAISQEYIQSITRYERGVLRTRTRRFANGQIRKQRSRDGKQSTWYMSGQLKNEFVRAGDLRAGKYESWYENGRLEIKSEYVCGFLHGAYTKWYENGNLEVKSNYAHGFLHGAYTKWYASGQTCKQSTYSFSKKVGTYMEWYETGQLEEYGGSGYYTLWREDGSLLDHGKCV